MVSVAMIETLNLCAGSIAGTNYVQFLGESGQTELTVKPHIPCAALSCSQPQGCRYRGRGFGNRF